MVYIGDIVIATKNSGSVRKDDACTVKRIATDHDGNTRICIDKGAYALTEREFIDIFGMTPYFSVHDYLELTHEDMDAFDIEYDNCITCVRVGEEKDSYDIFCNRLYMLGRLRALKNGGFGAEWSGMIERNLPLFRQFASKNWTVHTELSNENFVYEWISELHKLAQGYGTESIYKLYMTDLFQKIK